MNFLKKYVLPPIIALIYWLWTRTWRLKVYEAPEFVEALRNGRIIFSLWHGDELVMVRLGPEYHCAAMTSTSDDGELMTRVLKWLGFGISRGSSTRGGARALIGMIGLMREGYNATVAIDGPKGPVYKVKPGIWALSKHSSAPIAPIGVAKKSAYTFEKAWNKTYMPWPFSKVVVSFGKPLSFEENKALTEEELAKKLEDTMFNERKFAQSKLIGLLLAVVSAFMFAACSSTETTPLRPGSLESFMASPQRTQLVPVGRVLSGSEAPMVTYVLPNSASARYGFRVGDRILKLNGRDINSFTEFERKIKSVPSNAEIEFKSNGEVHSKNIVLPEKRSLFGMTTEPQNLPYIKRSAPFVSFLNKGALSVIASSSMDAEKKFLFVNFIVDSKVPIKHQTGIVSIYDKKSRKLLASGTERIDALGTASVLVTKKFPLDTDISNGVFAHLAVGKQQFTFEFRL